MLPGGHQPKVTRLSKAIAALLIVVFAVDFFVPSTSAYLALVPGRTLPCVWNLFTAGFVTTDAIALVLNCAALILLARLVEPVYGSKEFLKFISIVNLSCGTAVFVVVYVVFAANPNGTLLYTEFYGFQGIAMGLLVAVKQILGDQDAKLFGAIKINIKFLPGILLLAATAGAAALGQSHQLGFLYVGALSSYVYLRYFQPQGETGARGDASESFRFSGFFPAMLAPVVDPIASIFATVFRLSHAPAPEGGTPLKAGPSMLGSDVADANRRRERGAKALEARLGMKRPGGDVEAGDSGTHTHAYTRTHGQALEERLGMKRPGGDVEAGDSSGDAAAPANAAAYFGGAATSAIMSPSQGDK
ncbi:hypothetical protein FOA52_011528 [Chlamydomonas sp. UWO 241]|nr:hypothetical protein FOA52_011528 [Chlamydomonas sp. UWO 241]